MIALSQVNCFSPDSAQSAVRLVLMDSHGWPEYLARQPEKTKNALTAQGFKAETGRMAMLLDDTGRMEQILVGIGKTSDPWSLAPLPGKIPDSVYTIDDSHLPAPLSAEETLTLSYGWGLACYRFNAFKKEKAPFCKLVLKDEKTLKAATELLVSAYLARDLINLPANHLGPQELIRYAADTVRGYEARVVEISGEALLAENYPAIYEVGKASTNPPGLIDIRWGDPAHPKVTLVGKGVCFDTGGLDLKAAQNMRLMKKDMGGAAVMLALARLIMAHELPVCLRLLIPAVENSVAGNAFRPQDVIATRKGLTVEIGNTDAEGRLILGDALAEADGEIPDLLIDCATLTGAARTALGTDIPAFFTPDEDLAADMARLSRDLNEPLWRLPLHAPYEELLESKIADLNNAPDGPYAGAITAALFLKRFVEKTPRWMHIDMMAWNIKSTAGRPVGGEAQGLRTLFRLVTELAEA